MSLWRPGSEGTDCGAPTSPRQVDRVLFLDRDGVVIEDRHYISRPADAVLIDGAAEAMRRARAAGFALVGLSNQSGIGRGLYTEDDFVAVQRRVDELLAERGIGFDAFYYCPHSPQAECECRKPQPGLLREAERLFRWSAASSWLVGDKVADVQLAVAAGLGAALVLTGKGRQEAAKLPADLKVHVAKDLRAAVSFILTGEAA